MLYRNIYLLSKSEFGENLEQIAKNWYTAMESRNQEQEIFYSDLWDICKSALEFYEGKKIDFVSATDYFGVYIPDCKQWILRGEKGKIIWGFGGRGKSMKTLKEAALEYQSASDLHSIHFDIGVFWREDENWKFDTFITNRDEWVLCEIAKTDPNAVVLYNADYVDICDACLDDTLTRYIVADVSYYYNENNKDKSHNIYTFLEKEYPAKNTITEKEHDNMENAKQQQSMTRNDVIKVMEKELQELSECNTPIDGEKSYRKSEVMLEIARFLLDIPK